MPTPSKIGSASNPTPVTGASSLTFTHTVPATGANRALLVHVLSWVGSATQHTVTATYNGVAMTLVGFTELTTTGTWDRVTTFIMLNPPTGSAFNIVITPSQGSAEIHAYAQAYQDVDQTTPTGAVSQVNSSSGATSWSISGIAAAVNDLIVSFTGAFSGASSLAGLTPTGGATTDAIYDGNTALDSWGVAAKAAASTSESVGWSTGGVTATYWNIAFALKQAAASAPTIIAQPSDQTVNAGSTATFSVTASGGTAPLSYQWQDNSSGSFANIGGATSSSYAPTALFAMQGRQYRCVVTDAASNSVTSNAATLTVAFNLSGTGPRFSPLYGFNPTGLAPSGEFVRGTNAAGGGSTVAQAGAADGRGPATASVIVIAAGVSHARGEGASGVQVIVAGAADARGQAAGSSAQTIAVAGASDGRGQSAAGVALAATGAAEGRGPAAGGTVVAVVAAGAAEGKGPAAGLVAVAAQGNAHSISQTADAVLVIASGQSGVPAGSAGGAAIAMQGAAQAASQAAGVAASGGSGITAGESGGPAPATGLVVIAVTGVSTGGGAGAGAVAQTIAVPGEAGAPSGASVGVVISTRGESGAQGPAAANSVVLAVIPGVSQSNGGAVGLGVDGSAPATQASPYVGFIVNPGQLMKR